MALVMKKNIESLVALWCISITVIRIEYVVVFSHCLSTCLCLLICLSAAFLQKMCLTLLDPNCYYVKMSNFFLVSVTIRFLQSDFFEQIS